MAGLPRVWGVTASERNATYPCDDVMRSTAPALFRGVTVHAPPSHVFRWLCQLKIAPYSYDLIDNLGRRSPRELVHGLDELEVGQPVMDIFRVASFERDRHLTLVLTSRRAVRAYGRLALTYWVAPTSSGRSRLVVKLVAEAPRGPATRLRLFVLSWGDLLMMRRQLLTLKELAERDAARATGSIR